MGPAAHVARRPERENGAALVDPLPELVAEIRSLLDAPAGSEPPPRAVVDNLLTTGYAHALALEGERLRIEKRFHEVIRIGAEGGAMWADELPGLSQRLEQADRDLARLRGLLATLREHARSV
jgi:hypothetical protein